MEDGEKGGSASSVTEAKCKVTSTTTLHTHSAEPTEGTVV